MSSPHLSPKFKHFAKEYDAVVQCNRCGFCETACPTYVASGKETLSPRGRNQAFRQILEGRMDKPELAWDVFSTCLTCHACTNVCFSQVPVGKLMASARALVQESKNMGQMERLILRHILPRRGLFSALMAAAFLFKRLGLSGLLKKTGLLKMISPELDAGEDLLDKVPLRFTTAQPGTPQPSLSKKPRAAYFSGCGIHYLYPEASRSFVDILSRTSSQTFCPRHDCCGLPAQSAGDLEAAKKMARKNIDRFSKLDVDAIVADDDSCCGFLKNYGELLDGDLRAVAFSNKIKNLSQYLEETGPWPFLNPPKTHSNPANPVATYHDACQMGNGQKHFAPPREIMRGLKDTDFVELEESNWCCGGAGTYCLKHPGLADDVLSRKIANIEKSGASMVATQASSCLIHIQYGLRKKGLDKKIEALHLAEILQRQLKDGS